MLETTDNAVICRDFPQNLAVILLVFYRDFNTFLDIGQHRDFIIYRIGPQR